MTLHKLYCMITIFTPNTKEYLGVVVCVRVLRVCHHKNSKLQNENVNMYAVYEKN